jgi:hypothetical protein
MNYKIPRKIVHAAQCIVMTRTNMITVQYAMKGRNPKFDPMSMTKNIIINIAKII